MIQFDCKLIQDVITTVICNTFHNGKWYFNVFFPDQAQYFLDRQIHILTKHLDSLIHQKKKVLTDSDHWLN